MRSLVQRGLIDADDLEYVSMIDKVVIVLLYPFGFPPSLLQYRVDFYSPRYQACVARHMNYKIGIEVQISHCTRHSTSQARVSFTEAFR